MEQFFKEYLTYFQPTTTLHYPSRFWFLTRFRFFGMIRKTDGSEIKIRTRLV